MPKKGRGEQHRAGVEQLQRELGDDVPGMLGRVVLGQELDKHIDRWIETAAHYGLRLRKAPRLIVRQLEDQRLSGLDAERGGIRTARQALDYAMRDPKYGPGRVERLPRLWIGALEGQSRGKPHRGRRGLSLIAVLFAAQNCMAADGPISRERLYLEDLTHMGPPPQSWPEVRPREARLVVAYGQRGDVPPPGLSQALGKQLPMPIDLGPLEWLPAK